MVRQTVKSGLAGQFHPKTIFRDALSGFVSALVTIAYCISFSALLFNGSLQSGLNIGLAALLTGSAVTGIIVALTTTLPPADAGPDTPAIAVMSVLAGTVSAQIFAAGGGVELAVRHVLLAITLSTFATGVLLVMLGSLRMGKMLRFVPYPVIGGFLGASGWLLLVGAIEVIVGTLPPIAGELDLLGLVSSPHQAAQLTIGLVFAGTILLLRKLTDSFVILPVVFFSGVVLLGGTLYLLGIDTGHGWYLTGAGDLVLWSPMLAVFDGSTNWLVFARASAEIGAVCGVTAIALLLDVSSLEVARAKAADLDQEFRTNGIANGIAAVFGGVGGNLSLQASILIEEAGGVSRLCGVFAATTIGLVLVSGLDVATLVPRPILGGLLIYLGIVILNQALLRAPSGQSWVDRALALVILAVIVWFGYLVGVVLGVVAACLLFAYSYSRIGVVRRHLTRAQFSSNVDRSPDETTILRRDGAKIHVLWLSGYIFFGSSNGLFEYIRNVIDTQRDPNVRFVVLDFAGVTGFDSSAMLSLVKLGHYCHDKNVTLAFSGLDNDSEHALALAGVPSKGHEHAVFESRNDALEWCEDRLLQKAGNKVQLVHGFDQWLARELGTQFAIEAVARFFERREIPSGVVVYNQGQPSDTIDLVAFGRVAILISDDDGRPVRLRRMGGQTVVGEMGFFRHSPRAASVVTEETTVLYSLSREQFDRMQAERPEIGAAFMLLIIRALSDRVEFANREVAALM